MTLQCVEQIKGYTTKGLFIQEKEQRFQCWKFRPNRRPNSPINAVDKHLLRRDLISAADSCLFENVTAGR